MCQLFSMQLSLPDLQGKMQHQPTSPGPQVSIWAHAEASRMANASPFEEDEDNEEEPEKPKVQAVAWSSYVKLCQAAVKWGMVL